MFKEVLMPNSFYFLFDKENMPIGVTLKECKEDAIKLFCRIFKSCWDDLRQMGHYLQKEEDVPDERWNEIYKKQLKATRQVKIQESTPDISLKDRKIVKPSLSTILETERFLRQ